MTRSPLQTELELRGHDLPPSWDGAAVTWSTWESSTLEGHVFICPPPKVRAHCSRCGSVEAQLTCRGRRETDVGPWLLVAHRCPDCSFDQVWDLADDTWWDLGPEDYGDAGSVPPSASDQGPKRATPPGLSGAAKARAALDAARGSAPNERLF